MHILLFHIHEIPSSLKGAEADCVDFHADIFLRFSINAYNKTFQEISESVRKFKIVYTFHNFYFPDRPISSIRYSLTTTCSVALIVQVVSSKVESFLFALNSAMRVKHILTIAILASVT